MMREVGRPPPLTHQVQRELPAPLTHQVQRELPLLELRVLGRDPSPSDQPAALAGLPAEIHPSHFLSFLSSQAPHDDSSAAAATTSYHFLQLADGSDCILFVRYANRWSADAEFMTVFVGIC